MNRKSYIIENGFIKKEIIIEKKRISSFSYTNKIADTNLTAMDGSEVFELSFGKGFFKRCHFLAQQVPSRRDDTLNFR